MQEKKPQQMAKRKKRKEKSVEIITKVETCGSAEKKHI